MLCICCQYAINDVNVCGSMKEVSIKHEETFLFKTITWIFKSGKGKQECVKVCKNAFFALQS